MRTGWKVVVVVAMALGNLYMAEATIVWPAEEGWTALRNETDVYFDARGDQHPASVDLIGTAGAFSAGYWAFVENGHINGDSANDALLFRMRVGGEGGNYAWQVHLDTDNDTSNIEWILQLVNSGNPNNRGVELIETSVGGTTLADVDIGANSASWLGASTQYSRWHTILESTDFHVDIAMPWSDFTEITGVEKIEQLRVMLSTSTSHANINKDVLMGATLNQLVSDVLSESIPEPAVIPLLLTAVCGMFTVNRVFKWYPDNIQR